MANTPLSVGRHPRTLDDNRYVYAVLSRRARGVSIGINLNPDKVCNFDCIYCQVDRTTPPAYREVNEKDLLAELEGVLRKARDGSLFREPRFAGVPEEMRRVADISFAGDGEPTAYPRFREVVAEVVGLKRRLGLADLPVSVLTNCTVLDRPAVREALSILDADRGEVWAKLDAGTEEMYERICVPGGARFGKILENIRETARLRPVVIQSLFLRHRDAPPPPGEIEAFCARLRELVAGGARIRLVQIYTVARRPPYPEVTPLLDPEVDAIVTRVREETGLPVEGYYGSTEWMEEPACT
jgi:wyosine [tRNA(Phe)-imidazoG37] synthetase (radical SAM superfamily)